MRILVDTLYFCGIDSTGLFIGWMNLSTFYMPNNVTINLRHITPLAGQNIRMKLAVYTDPHNSTRLIALGSCLYDSNNPIPPTGPGVCPIAPNPCIYMYTPPYQYFPGWTTSQEDFVLECVNPQAATLFTIKLVNSASKNEHLTDVVVTDNYVAFVGNIFSGDEFDTVTIHRCKKDDILGSFDSHYYFLPPWEEGTVEYMACALDDNNIALVTTGVVDPGNNNYEIRVRTVKLSSMTMTTAQRLPVEGKPIQIAQTYLYQANKTMVHLSDYRFPPGQQNYNYTFVEFLPYKLIAYYTTAFYEKRVNKTFESMDVIQDTCLISTGGNYGFIKDIKHEDPSSICYYYENVYVRITNTRTIHEDRFPYEGNRFSIDTITSRPYTVSTASRRDPCQ